MAESIARQFFANRLSAIEKKRNTCVSNPLTSKEITSLVSLHRSGEPIYQSIEDFYSEEYKNRNKLEDSQKVEKYRHATQEEANLLYSDLHARDIND